eukprot:4684660-Pleurochrysis_carterae.AAC.1
MTTSATLAGGSTSSSSATPVKSSMYIPVSIWAPPVLLPSAASPRVAPACACPATFLPLLVVGVLRRTRPAWPVSTLPPAWIYVRSGSVHRPLRTPCA